mmetsp:Transcript_26080/g.70651  ORF Transcript_26080/g.70651 Transcript_26080/m.70651 type:complete len:204 (-) Transcript_26080:1984-2595(-)
MTGQSVPKECPGPQGYLILGHIPYLLQPNYFSQLTEWANKYGGIYKLDIAGPTYILSDAQLAQAVICARGDKLLHKSKMYSLFSELSFDEPNVFNDTEDGEQWQVYRKAMASCFSTENIKASFPNTRRQSKKMVSIWQEIQVSHPDQAVGVELWVQRLFLDIIGHEFGKDFKALDGQHCEVYNVTQDALSELSMRVANPLRRP